MLGDVMEAGADLELEFGAALSDGWRGKINFELRDIGEHPVCLCLPAFLRGLSCGDAEAVASGILTGIGACQELDCEKEVEKRF